MVMFTNLSQSYAGSSYGLGMSASLWRNICLPIGRSPRCGRGVGEKGQWQMQIHHCSCSGYVSFFVSITHRGSGAQCNNNKRIRRLDTTRSPGSPRERTQNQAEEAEELESPDRPIGRLTPFISRVNWYYCSRACALLARVV
jgi:hypothetical protein